MPRIEHRFLIRAPAQRCFDLSRSIDLHTVSTAQTGERAIAGVTSGLIGLDQEVTWRARHFGLWLHLTSRITAFDPPHHFRDSMVRGPFRRFDHDHHFTSVADGTLVHEVFDYDAPLGPLGWLSERLFLSRYMARFLDHRNQVLRKVAESDEWRRYA